MNAYGNVSSAMTMPLRFVAHRHRSSVSYVGVGFALPILSLRAMREPLKVESVTIQTPRLFYAYYVKY